jgi:uncharacterized protein YndB with AHSA1/START domain
MLGSVVSLIAAEILPPMKNMTLQKIATWSLALASVLASTSLSAEVVDASPNGFTVRQELLIKAERTQVYDAAVNRVGQWWSSAHTFSGDADNLYLEPRLQGCFCERIAEEGGVVHLLITFISPNHMLRLTGGLGPLGLLGVSGNMTWEFQDANEGTLLVLTYVVGGYSASGLDTLATPVDNVLAEQMTRLKNLLETGKADSQS